MDHLLSNYTEANLSQAFKIGRHRDNYRVWLEGEKLLNSGFMPGSKYNLIYANGDQSQHVILELNPEGKKKVSNKNGTHPIIDICNKKITAFIKDHFESQDSVQVDFRQNTIIIKGV